MVQAVWSVVEWSGACSSAIVERSSASASVVVERRGASHLLVLELGVASGKVSSRAKWCKLFGQ